jgi:hypothetical protein
MRIIHDIHNQVIIFSTPLSSKFVVAIQKPLCSIVGYTKFSIGRIAQSYNV